MKKTDNQQGFILVLTLMLLSIGVLLVTQLSHRGMVHIHFDQTMIDREKAKELALGGLQLAISQLTIKETDESKKPAAGKPAASVTSSGKKEEKDSKQEFLKKLIPALNRWQTFELKEKVDGIDGTVQFAISCEQGKINLNQVYDFETKKFIGEGQQANDMKKIMQTWFGSMKKFTGDKDFFSPFATFLKERQYKLNDATELLSNTDFQKAFMLNVFYEPPTKDSKGKRPIFLTDLFTVWSHTQKLQPWVLSDSVIAVLNLKRAQAGEVSKREKQVAEVLKEKNLKDAAQVWDKQLQPFYGKDFKSLPKDIQGLMDPSFEPSVFSVLSYGIVGGIKQKIFAIIEKRSDSDKDGMPFEVKKLYWF